MKKEMQKVILISCTKSKRKYPCAARELYDPSPQFHKSLSYAEKITKNIYVISAKHGLISLDQFIEPYDYSLYDMTANEAHAWGVLVARQLCSLHDFDNTEFVILAGEKYYLPLLQHLPQENVSLPLKGLRIGDRLKKLDQLIASSAQEKTICYKLHNLFAEMPRFYWDTIDAVSFNNGIYIIFQENEKYHNYDRVVRVGTHRSDGRLKGRLKDHFINENKDGSIFRKNIGRALLNLNQHDYIHAWNKNTSKPNVVAEMGSSYKPDFQKLVEGKISKLLRESFSFVCFPVTDADERLRLEEGIIATLNSTADFGPSYEWNGKHSTESEIRDSGMWLKEGLDGIPLSESEFTQIERYCAGHKSTKKEHEEYEPLNSNVSVSIKRQADVKDSKQAEMIWHKIFAALNQHSNEFQTVRKSGKKGKWFSAGTIGGFLEVRNAVQNKPSCSLSMPRRISREEFIALYPNYYEWRKGKMPRSEANGYSKNGSYIFALINRFDAFEDKA